MDKRCEWYLLCDNSATGTTPHPILGEVPICQRCAGRHDLLVSPFPDPDLAYDQVMGEPQTDR